MIEPNSELKPDPESFAGWEARNPHQQICSFCHEVCTVDFWVPDHVWKYSMQQCFWHNLACLRCFTRFADIRGIEWSRDIKLYPESRVIYEEKLWNHKFLSQPL